MTHCGSFLAKVFATDGEHVRLFCELVDEDDYENGIETLTVSSINVEKSKEVDRVPLLVKVDFVAEGAANVLFAMTPERSQTEVLSGAEDIVDRYLLRLRKAAFKQGSNVPPYVSAEKLCHFIETEVKPSIPSHFLVDHLRVAYSEKFLVKCNTVLMAMEKNGTRELKRHGGYFDDSTTRVGLLVENMKPSSSDSTALLEFKTKWLHQSPGAPLNSRRCRTCAWHIKNNVHSSKRYCPLALVSGNKEVLIGQLKRFPQIWRDLPETWNIDQTIEVLADYLADPSRGHGMLNLIRELQKELDPHGILKIAPLPLTNYSRDDSEISQHVVQEAILERHAPLQRLSHAMTLRDCTVFIRIIRTDTGSCTIEAKLGDLDPKPPEEEKVTKWAKDERSLVVDGHYEGIETVQTHSNNGCETEEVCMLWKES
jgi:inositol-pentakisphosphate 2-kinase